MSTVPQEVQAFTLCCARVRGKKQNTFYPDERTINNLDDLLKAAQLDHTPGFFKDAHREKAGWYWAECVVLDVDNTDGGKVTTPEDVERDFPDVGHYIVFSRHHEKPKPKDDGKSEYPAAPRFHIYFPISAQFTGDQMDAFIKKAIASRPYFDPCCDGRARFIFGVENPQGEAVPGTLTLDDFLAQQAAPVATVPAALPASTGTERIIPAGERHNHMVKVATQVLTRCGPGGIEQARDAYDREAEHLEGYFPQGEIDRIWTDQLAFAQANIWNQPGYLTPAEYAVQGFQDVAPALQGEIMFKLSDLSDVAEGVLFAKNFKGTVLYNTGLTWLVWDGARFKQSEGQARKLAHKFTALQLEAAQAAFQKASAGAAKDLNDAPLQEQYLKAKKFLSFVAHCRETTGIDHLLKEAAVHLEVDADALDAAPDKLNTPAGIIDLRTGELHPNDPAERCTKITSVAPSDTGADIWQGFLEQVTCGDTDMARYLQELAGMAAYGKQVNEGIVMAVGDGGNGKSTLFNVLARVLGDYAGSINPKILLASRGKSYDAETVELRGLRLAIAAETEEGARLDSSAVKQLGSQDRISARPLYGKPIAFWPSHTLVLFTNFLPKVGSRDDGTWSRLKIAPFKAKLRGAKGEIKDFASYLYENAGGAVLAWVVEGARRFIANGFKIDPPEAARAALIEYSRENDWLQDFIDDCCDVGPTYTAGSQELYNIYAMHCQATGASYKRDAREFRQALTAAGYESRRQNKGVRFYGLGLKSAAAPEA